MVHAVHTSATWCFRWQRDGVTELELAWVHERREWQQRAEHDGAGWSDPVVLDLDVPQDEDDAQEIAEHYAGEKTA